MHYTYKLRPCYNSDDLLIEFVRIGNSDSFTKELLDLLSKNGFTNKGISDVWMNDEIWIHLSSQNGEVTITKDIYDLIFILGENNQTDILRIDKVLMDSGRFEKEDVNFDDYKKPKQI